MLKKCRIIVDVVVEVPKLVPISGDDSFIIAQKTSSVITEQLCNRHREDFGLKYVESTSVQFKGDVPNDAD